ncbi:mechanosensitive ion channel family protein [Parerythrobacter jejuensis]|uniref:Small-conductance mechanosensitive channel n=1 Tax=Parerythrobacter jejuensis TaxID=795812 RepID=A0A845AM73_9SPHN|nr:mechanosensitive ion channel family protein [Parerythrobacter jejuensis]MXP30714.1 mechanosensitive ion channel [Parerythrobacter jejuensis]MXP33474.1 mechanosensitive ion channel [Parerythrobacter jejuensis]
MIRFWLSLLALVALTFPAHALLPTPAESPADAVPAATQTIDDTRDEGADKRIRERIEGIFAELPAFQALDVSVSEGVVRLEGAVDDAADIARAESIAGRIEGVVTIDNQIERDLTVGDGIGALSDLTTQLASWVKLLPLIGFALLVALAISLLGYVIASLGWLWRKITPNSFLADLIASAIRFVFVILGMVVALDMIGAGALLGAVLGGAGVIGIALGFAMRDTVENYVASLMLSLRQPFRANDHVLIDDLEGRVIRLTSRATVMMTMDGNHLRIPNSTVFKAIITNYTRNPQRRLDFMLGVDADDDPRSARDIGKATLENLPFILNDPPPEAVIEEVGDSNISIRFLGWIDQREADYKKARSRAIPAVKDALEDAGFGLPEPIYRLRFDSRTMPLPFENIGEKIGRDTPKPSPEKRKPAAPAKTHDKDDDVSPEDGIAQMVEAERATDSEASDLLDAERPVE